MSINLTLGAIEAICNGNSELKPLVQVMEIRLLNSQTNGSVTERYRLMISDGQYVQQGMLATQQNELIKSGRLRIGSIVQLIQHACSSNKNQRLIIVILRLEVISESCSIIGEPKQYLTTGARQPELMTGTTQHENPQFSGSSMLQQPKVEPSVHTQSYGTSNRTNIAPSVYPKPEFTMKNSGSTGAAGSLGGLYNAKEDMTHTWNSYTRPPQPSMYMNRGSIARNEVPPRIIPIDALNPYQGRWTIKARVTAKSELRHYNNTRGDGKVFSFDLLDCDGGEIRVTCFNAVADQFYDQVEVGRVYLLSKGTLKPAQKNFNHLPNDQEIFLDATSVVQLCYDDDGKIPRHKFHFRPISDIEGLESNNIIDLIGIVHSVSPSFAIMRKNGTETKKRSLHLKDMSGRSVELTLWGSFCDAEGHTLQSMCDTGRVPVLAVKAGQVSEFNGKAVGTLSTSQLFIEPDFPEAQLLKEWFHREGKNAPFISISRGISSVRTDIRKTISQIKDEKLGTFEKPDWITVCCTITFMKMDNFCYTACPISIGDRQCNKKVTNNGDGKWRCDRCDQCVDECDYRYILQFQISDHTGLTWVTAFQEIGEEILGSNAKNLFYLKYEEQDEQKFQDIVHTAVFSKYILKLKVKEETFSDEQRVKSTVVKAERMSFSAESRHLLDVMDKLQLPGSAPIGAKTDSITPNVGLNSSGTSNIGVNSSLVGKETGFSNNVTYQYGNQYNGGYRLANAPDMFTATCSSCGGTGHSSANCPSFTNDPGQSTGPYFNQVPSGATTTVPDSRQCFNCNKFGHYAKDCPGLDAVPPAYGVSNVAPGRYGGV